MSGAYLRNDGYHPVDGNVFESFKKMNEIFSANDGRRYYRELENTCYDSDAPYDHEKQTHMRLTKSEHDINCLGEAYFKRHVAIKIQYTSPTATSVEFPAQELPEIASADDTGTNTLKDHVKPYAVTKVMNLNRIFIGYKSSNKIFRQLEVETDRGDTGYLQMEMVKEGFAYATYKPKSERKTKKFVHSLYNNVQKMDNSVCGCYFNPNDGGWDKNTHTRTIEFDMIIPLNDLLAFQAFDDYPKSFGDIILKYYNTPHSLVYCQVDPARVSDILNVCYEELHDKDYALAMSTKFNYTREFEQIGQPTNLITAITKKSPTEITPTTNPVTIQVVEMRITEDKFIVPGYGVIESTARDIPTLFNRRDPFMIPAQQIDVRTLNQGCVTSSGIVSDFTYALHNVTDIVAVFPMRQAQRTVFRNPMVRNLQITIDGRNFPDNAMSTVGDIFFTRMLQASDLDGVNECTEEYEDSLTRDRCTAKKQIYPWKDQTSFICTIPVMRDGGSVFFDGLETKNNQVSIRLQANPIHSNAEADVYCTKSPDPPQIWFTRTTYWTWSPEDGLKYHATGTPAKYASPADNA
ncbi:hypothetical protein TVAGG3_0055640 [Trichomonas vaginalis G3]|uniref:hypothetical protein n=1 Tax=Trichomonas vaginalis (strain ATCC PRA-98 / G3) TaxID=412133 RepID=UPI0021E53008|nr:hypothetical protein TVAGG3_0055640 [Trichomonas vaginalis G3]KAI5541622.1 hypothetical protein TVAGG3_0055640 [Trichomonas vaginalis G3]